MQACPNLINRSAAGLFLEPVIEAPATLSCQMMDASQQKMIGFQLLPHRGHSRAQWGHCLARAARV